MSKEEIDTTHAINKRKILLQLATLYFRHMDNIDNTDEKALLRQMILGHQAAWEHIANSYFPILYSYVMRLVQEEMVAEEIVQDVFVNVWAKRNEIEIRISLKAYLFRAARNQSLNYIKRRKFEGNYQRNLALTFEYASLDTENTVHFEELQKHWQRPSKTSPTPAAKYSNSADLRN